MGTVFVTIVDVNEKEVTVFDTSEEFNNNFPLNLFNHDKSAGTWMGDET